MWIGIEQQPWRNLQDIDSSSAERLVDSLVEMMHSLQTVDAASLGARVRLPENEVAASPFGLRAVRMGGQAGAAHVHRELTRVPAWDSDARTASRSHDMWESGVLQTGKYQAFIQDGAHSLFDPSHIAKWGPHEMMHRSCSFFWRRDASPFEHYLGARLNELLPVALWYGADQFARLDEEEFVRHASPREVQRARWRDADDTALREQAQSSLGHMRWFAHYLDRELADIDEEIRTGKRIESRWPIGGATLNASSDALAYAVAHRGRLESEAVGRVLEATPHFDSIRAYRAHIETRIETLLFGELGVVELDVGDNAEREGRDAWHQTLSAAIGGDIFADADGIHGFDLGQLAGGIEESLPHAFEWLERYGGQWLESFAESPQLWRRAPLASRLRDFCREALPDAPAADFVELGGAWLAVKEDARVSELSDAAGCLLIRNSEARILQLDYDLLAMLDGDLAIRNPDPSVVLVTKRAGEVLTLALDASLMRLFSILVQGPVPYDEAVAEVGVERVSWLLDAGAVARWAPVD